MKTEILPFNSEMIPEAGRLLAQRHQRNREALPLLPERFEDSEVAKKAVEALWQEKSRGGYAAFSGGSMIAYLIGETSSPAWGRSGTVYLPGYAVANGQNPSILQDLYAALGDEWVRKGCFNHYLYVSAADRLVVDALFDLGFGKDRTDALLDLLAQEVPEVEEPTGVIIRKAGQGDNARLGSLSNVISRAVAKAPYWHPSMPEDWAENQEGWSELAEDKDWTVWLALEHEEALGSVGFRPEQEADTHMLASPHTVYLSVAATKPEARGRGISTVLSWYGLDQTRQQGYEVCYTNWSSPNLLASRFWPRFGFQDAAYRLAKKVSPMIAWAREE